MARAGALSSILVEYAWDSSRVSCDHLRAALEILDDLLYVGYSMLEYWDEDREDLTQLKTKEGER